MVVLAAVVAILALISVAVLSRSSAVSEQHGLQTIDVRLGTDGAIHAVSAASVVREESGRVAESREDLAPAEAVGDLPVRVQTAWWHAGASGTDLQDLDGREGRFVVQVTVQDLTAEVTELSVETGGARYRQQALVGVPLTVVASAGVGAADRVVQVVDDQGADPRVTDGVLVETADGGRSVQWAAFLAAPMLSPTASFTLVVDSADFRVPDVDLTVHPGLVTDPSVAALIDRAYGADGYAARLEGSTIAVVQRVSRNLAEALGFVDAVHAALEQDVAHLGERTYSDLGLSSETVLSHLERTVEDLDAVLGSARSGVSQVGSQTRSGVQALSRSIADVLGSPGARPELTATVVRGCRATMPTLAEGQARTVSSTVHLADAQLRAIAALFADGRGAPSDNCRTALHELVTSTVGDPSVLEDPAAAATCRSVPEADRTIACTLAIARGTLRTDLAELEARQDDVRDVAGRLAVPALADALGGGRGLAATLTGLRTDLVAARAGSGAVRSDLAGWVLRMQEAVDRARVETAAAHAGLAEVVGAVEEVAVAGEVVRTALLGGVGGVGSVLDDLAGAAAGAAGTGQWFAPYVTALRELVAALDDEAAGCPAGWEDGLGPDATADQITDALHVLDVPGCPVAGPAAAAVGLVAGYAGTAAVLDGASADAAGARATLDALADDLAGLDAAVADLRSLTGSDGGLAAALRALEDAEAGTGTLVEVAQGVAEVSALVEAGGALPALDEHLAGLVALVSGLWPDEAVQPVASADGCAAVQPSPDRRPEPAGQAVVWLGNRLLCLEADLGRRLTDLDDRVDQAAASTDAQLGLTTQRTQDAGDRAHHRIGTLSSGLVSEVTAQREAATAASQALVAESHAEVREEMDAILAAYDLASGGVLQQLTEAMQQSGAQSTAVAASLGADFADLLVNLGSPEPTSRGGLLGKLHGITTQVGDTGGVLDSVAATTTAHGNVRSAELRDIDLRAAQFAAAEARLAAYRPFVEVDEDLETVFVFQVRGAR